MRKLFVLNGIMLFATVVSFSTAALAAEHAVSKSAAAGDIPGLDRIKADASRHFVVTEEGLPVIRALASPPSIHGALVNSSVRAGDLLLLDVTLSLTDQASGKERNYMANSRMSYRETDGEWDLQSIEQNSIRELGSRPRVNEDDC